MAIFLSTFFLIFFLKIFFYYQFLNFNIHVKLTPPSVKVYRINTIRICDIMSLTKLNDNGHFQKEQFDRNVKKM